MTTTIPNAEHKVTTLKELRNSLGTKINEAAFAGARPLISRNGKTVAAIVSYDDLKEYEELLDIEALRKARAEDDGYRISLEDYLEKNK